MAAETSRDLELEFVIAYPRQAEVGKRYLMTVDVRAREPVPEWPYAEEEYALYCMVDSEPAFTNEPVGQTAVVLHRFGGTYGPARFVLTAREPMDEASIRLTLVNAAGLPLRQLELTDIQVMPPTPRTHPPPIEVWLDLWKQSIDQYGVRLTSEVRQLLVEHTASAIFSRPTIFDEQHEFFSEARIHLGTELFFKLFNTAAAQFGWRAVRELARLEGRPIRLLVNMEEPINAEQLYDPDAGSFFVLSEHPRIRIVRVNRESRPTRLELPPRPRLLLVALALQDHHQAASVLMKLARETADAYDVSLLGPNGPRALREVVSTLPPEAWTPDNFLPFCDTRTTDLSSLSRLKGWELLHLLVSGLENVHAEEPRHPVHSAVYGLLSRELQLSGHFQLVFVQACRPYERRPAELIYGHANFFSGGFHQGNSALAAVIAPLVPLDAEGSTSLAASFYRRLAQGHPLDEALQGGARLEDLTPLFMHLWARPGALDPVRLAEAEPVPKPQLTSRKAPENSLGWLFLSNVLAGSGSFTWENGTQALLEDVERLYEKSGPWDLVLCAGDLTWTGAPREFELASGLFTELERRLMALGMDPLILTVPGNHDGELELIRDVSQKLPVDLSLTNWQPLLADAFKGYSTAWQHRWQPPQEGTFRRGLVPGDFSMTLLRNGVRWGIIGLNNVLTPRGDTENPRRQLDAVCGGDFAAWFQQHDACVLLAHDEFQGFEEQWLSKARKAPFILHLTGRSHDAKNSLARVSSSPFVVWHGRTLFPHYTTLTTDFPSGYFAGRLTLEGEESRLRVWPRSTGSGLGRRLSVKADREHFKLAEDEGFELAHTVRRAPAARNSEDWAIVVGISHYPELGNLEGPDNDARAFRDWLLEKAGVPPEQVLGFLSSDFESARRAQDARPTAENIESLFEQLISLGEENEQRGSRHRVGRRLYIYLAGHGFMSGDGYPSLLTANARRRVHHHIPGWIYASYLAQAGYFDELLLFVDCSLLGPFQTAPRVPPYMPREDSPSRAKVFRAFSTIPPPHREHRTPDGRVQGVFTQALLAALNGRASDERGRITSTTLGNYLREGIREFQTPEERQGASGSGSLDIIYDPSPDAEFVIATVPPVRYRLEYRFDPSLQGQRVRLMSSRFKIVDEFQLLDPTMHLEYGGGSYWLELLGARHLFTLRQDSVLRISQDGERVHIQLEPLGGAE
ncbi:MAG TPA: caspase family protein [Archangium sp.]|nr:caspase family protein [Archangium sp.]